MQFQILRTAAAMRPTVRAAKACWPKQLQRINYASLAKTKAHTRAHMARISVSHTHTHTQMHLCVPFSHLLPLLFAKLPSKIVAFAGCVYRAACRAPAWPTKYANAA